MVDGQVVADKRVLEAVARRRDLRHAQNERLMAVYDWIEQHRSNKGESE
jgi:hypothetical protein